MLKRDFLRGAAASAVLCSCGRHAIGAPGPGFCGFVDPPHPTAGGLVPKSFQTKGAGRGKTAMTFSFSGTVLGVGGPAAVVPVLKAAFTLWRGPVPGLSFTQVASNADITIVAADSKPPMPAGAVATTAPDGRTIYIKPTQLYRANNAAPNTPGSADLLSVITHEIGHALGLLHASTTASIMFPNSSGQEVLGPDDSAAIKALYGWSPQDRLQGATEATPALCACGNTLLVAWRGSGDDHNIWLSTSTDGKAWTPQRKLGDVGTVASPGLAWDGGRAWLVWRGTGSDQGLYFKASGDFFVRDNPKQTPIAGTASSTGPRIAIVSGLPTMAWKGINDDHRIYTTQFAGGKWQPQSVVPGVGTEASPAICQDIGGGPRLLWRGIGNDHVLWTTFSSAGQTPIWQPQTQLRWGQTGNLNAGTTGFGTAGSMSGPGLALVNNVIQAVWRGSLNDDGLYFTQLALDTVGASQVLQWSSQTRVPNTGTSDGPSVAMLNGNLHMVWKGIPNDRGLYHAQL